MVDAKTGRLNRAWLETLADDLAEAAGRGQQLIVVSSGAIALGRRHLGLPAGRLRLEESQAAAAVGQIRLARAWQEILEDRGLAVAQVLLTLEDTEERRRYLNARATLNTLLALGASAALTTSRYDGTALIAAAHLGHAGVVRQLIAAGAPLDHVNNLHWTAAIEAVVLGDGGPRHQDTLAALIRAGANLQLADRQGNTPLALARSRGYREMQRMLEAAAQR